MTKAKLLQTVGALIDEGNTLLHRHSKSSDGIYTFIDKIPFMAFQTKCVNLARILGEPAAHLMDIYLNANTDAECTMAMVGSLMGLKDLIDNDILLKVERLVMAEAFDDFIQQADALFAAGHYIPAAVLARGVLEEHLNKWCQRERCVPTPPPNHKNPAKWKPTMSDYYASLAAANHITPIERRHVETIADVGNKAAHTPSQVKEQDVERMLRDVGSFLVQHP